MTASEARDEWFRRGYEGEPGPAALTRMGWDDAGLTGVMDLEGEKLTPAQALDAADALHKEAQAQGIPADFITKVFKVVGGLVLGAATA
jgi:hypothetical protein